MIIFRGLEGLVKLTGKGYNIHMNKTVIPKRTRSFFSQWDLQAMALPGILLLLVFAYFPMWGLIMAFQNFDLYKGFSGSDFVGFKNFLDFFKDASFSRILWNTLLISVLKLIFVFPAPIILAILLNEIRYKKYKSILQTITYLPNFISWVIVSGMMFAIFAVDGGDINQVLLASDLVKEPINFFSEPSWFLPLLVGSNMWKTMGFSAIVYLAAIAGIDPGLYEASQIDGVDRLRQIWYITLPSILPVITIFLVLTIASILTAGFDDILLLTKNGTNAMLRNTSEVIDTYVYRMGIKNGRFSYASAAGLFKSIISVILLWTGNRLARKWIGSSLW